ncbi:hypothetical protein RRG08_062281 [Elysia crispata]|uniref:Uncharacterized protein n=1 Tax=Elysia crispata TaxID=231223 RepID=A0AAE0YHV2_9GAST|nr:hypothetical protein RRG08_062281 [Elysia crispata]
MDAIISLGLTSSQPNLNDKEKRTDVKRAAGDKIRVEEVKSYGQFPVSYANALWQVLARAYEAHAKPRGTIDVFKPCARLVSEGQTREKLFASGLLS